MYIILINGYMQANITFSQVNFEFWMLQSGTRMLCTVQIISEYRARFQKVVCKEQKYERLCACYI